VSRTHYVRGQYDPGEGLVRIHVDMPEIQDGWTLESISLIPYGDYGADSVTGGLWCAQGTSLFFLVGTNDEMLQSPTSVTRFRMTNAQIGWAVANGNHLSKPYTFVDPENWVAEDLFVQAWTVNDQGTTTVPSVTFNYILELKSDRKSTTGALLEMVADRSQANADT